MFIMVTVGLLTWLVSQSKGDTTCLSCKMAVRPQDCETIIRCAAGESCITETVVTTVGFLRYNVGCKDDLQCAAAMQIGRRSTNDGMVVCTECCNTDLCNSGGCGTSRYPDRANRGPLCFQCQEQKTSYGCSHITECGRNQVCRYSRTYNPVTSEKLYTTRCAERTECASVNPAFAQLLCDHCCDQDLCNHGCVNAPTTPPSLTNSPPVTTARPPIVNTLPPIVATSALTAATSLPISMTSPQHAGTVDACTPSPCVIGTCSLYLSTYRCTCPHGVHGRNCDIYTNPCVSSPCVHGQCVSNKNTFTCTCQPGYSGTLCDQAIDHCLMNPCNYGTCSSNPQGFSCTCDPGYTGITCSTAIDHCLVNPCNYGTCSNRPQGYSCTCDQGYTGNTCDTAIDYCLSNPCNYGTCASNHVGFVCTCDQGYTGITCDTVINHCHSIPCHNKGTCVNLVHGFTCNCGQGYTGNTCDAVIDHCLANPCDYGTCSNTLQGFSCTCDQGYTGTTCDTAIDHCQSNPCVHGTCHTRIHGFRCTCEFGYTGTTCDTEKCIPFQNGCYYFAVYTHVTFAEAQWYCQQKHGAYLVTIETAAENYFLKSTIAKLNQVYYWVGFSDQAVEGWFTWIHTGANLTFTDWHPGEPNNLYGRENCGEMGPDYNYEWNDSVCDSNMSPLCEKR